MKKEIKEDMGLIHDFEAEIKEDEKAIASLSKLIKGKKERV